MKKHQYLQILVAAIVIMSVVYIFQTIILLNQQVSNQLQQKSSSPPTPYLPSFFQLNGTWSSHKPWIWTDTKGEKWGENQRKFDTWNKDISIVFYGSSHLREIYFSQIRIETNVPIGTDLSAEIRRIPSGDPEKEGNRALCDPGKTGYTAGLYGIDLKNCGNPGFRIVRELSNKTVIGFKTFLHTPEADALFLKKLEAKHVSNPDLVLVDIGIWGARGKRGNGILSVAQEISYFIDWTQTHFKTVIWVYGGSGFDAQIITELKRRKRVRDVIFDKTLLLDTRPKRMPCGHGCAGPLMRVEAQIIRRWITEWFSQNTVAHP